MVSLAVPKTHQALYSTQEVHLVCFRLSPSCPHRLGFQAANALPSHWRIRLGRSVPLQPLDEDSKHNRRFGGGRSARRDASGGSCLLESNLRRTRNTVSIGGY